MSQSAAKAKRRAERHRLRERIAQAHDRLHKDDVGGCHDQLHAALGLDDGVEVGAPLVHRDGFADAFRRLCLQHDVRAAFVLIDTIDDDGDARLLSGGDAELSTVVDKALRSANG